MTHLRKLLPLLGLVAVLAWAQPATKLQDAARGPAAVPDTTRPPMLGNAVNDDVRRPRNYDTQPPTIPHRVDGYQVDRNFNKCLDCHARGKASFSQAIPVSATHYFDRSGKELPHISTRRYFCMQCHVPQDSVPPIVGNSFGAAPPVSLPANK
ncbi:nitrate reductase cytochrome c-type subunit [Ramlibacter sp. PS3R-8]|uniref:nitrate reductase cytochrome c-type subunit n=1 Tax=Ramlibacter sp. PS3R-8 TaxID=3133437 RepID=UPI003096334B